MAQIMLVLGVLVWLLGWIPVAAGLTVLLCLIPLATLSTMGFSHVRVKVLECTDARVRLISEVRCPNGHAALAGTQRLAPEMSSYNTHAQSCSQADA